jgi:cytochrome c peroxidase
MRPANGPSPANLVTLGQTLFNDKRLSSTGTVSCATCHAGTSTTDGRMVAVGLGVGTRNTPAVLNRAFAANHMFDGRAPSLEAQSLMPIQHSKEMGRSFRDVLTFLRGDAAYVTKFMTAFSLSGSSAITIEHVARALAAFQRTLVTPASTPPVRSAGGLSATALAGRGLFFGKAQCSGCHSGPNLSDERFHNTGFPTTAGADPGLAARTHNALDRGKFKTPGLRNVRNTAPYFHNGSASTLAAVVQFYNRGGDAATNRDPDVHPLGLTATEVSALVAFLQTL